ncbi:hypothetical protein Tco_0330895 [Tanacetum coccineum]
MTLKTLMKDSADFNSVMFKRFNHRFTIQEMNESSGIVSDEKLKRRNWKHITVQNNDENNVFANERQHSAKHAAECADERVALANLIANLTLILRKKNDFKAIKTEANASETEYSTERSIKKAKTPNPSTNGNGKPRSSMFKRRLIAADQASVFMAMTSVHISSGLVLHQMTSDHNRSELGIQDHSNEPSSSKAGSKSCSSSSQDS